MVFPVMTGEDTSRSHPPAGAMFRGSVSPVCIDQRKPTRGLVDREIPTAPGGGDDQSHPRRRARNAHRGRR
jgi:hypothetical protein